MRLNLGLGAASHVLVRIARFRTRHFAELRRLADSVPWRDWLPRGQARSVRATSRHSKLIHTGGIAERVRAGIEAQVGPAPGEGDDVVPIAVRMSEDECTISIDTSGAALHQRGWRLETAKAPLREDLAHAMVLASAWDPATPFVDPFCGSGTLAIIAACLARGLAPGRGRRFAFERLAWFRASAFETVRAGLEPTPAAAAETIAVFGSDRDAGAVGIAQRNAERAGVAADIDFAEASFTSAPGLASAGDVGAVVTNPPFGVRIGEVTRLAPLYQSLGNCIRALGPGWRVAILAAERRLALRTGLQLKTAFLSNHGGLRVRALVGSA